MPSSDAIPFHAVVGPKDVPGSEFDARMCKYRPDHRWYYFSNMTPDELLVFKGYDSEGPHAMNAMHTAFDNPAAGPHAIPRESIEARMTITGQGNERRHVLPGRLGSPAAATHRCSRTSGYRFVAVL